LKRRGGGAFSGVCHERGPGQRPPAAMKEIQIPRKEIQACRNEIQAGWNKFQISRNEIQIQISQISFAESILFKDLR
jgi:hypothetical protein